jgi:hypothetical protein
MPSRQRMALLGTGTGSSQIVRLMARPDLSNFVRLSMYFKPITEGLSFRACNPSKVLNSYALSFSGPRNPPLLEP